MMSVEEAWADYCSAVVHSQQISPELLHVLRMTFYAGYAQALSRHGDDVEARKKLSAEIMQFAEDVSEGYLN